MKRWKSLMVCAASLTLVTLFAAAGPTDRDAGSKMRGEFGGSARSAGRSIRHARDYSQDYRYYAGNAAPKKVKPVVAQEHADGVGANIKLAQAHCAAMKKEAGDDKETLASIAAIEKQLAAAKKAYETMDEMCQAHTIDTTGTMTCCMDIDKALEAAIAEYEKLVKRLGGERPEAEKKDGDK